MKSTALFVLLIGCICFFCTEYTPKPKGYFRIEPEPHRYHSISGDNLFFNFKASDLAKISYSPITDSVMWVCLLSPVTIYLEQDIMELIQSFNWKE